MSSVKCPLCGTMVPTSRFCSECGAVLFKEKESKDESTNTASSLLQPPFNIRDLASSDNSQPINKNTSVSDVGLKMLVNCCRKTVATVGGDGYSEYVLYERAENEYELHYYRKYESDPQETHLAYKADKTVVDEVYSFLKRAKLEKYDGKDSGLCGGDFIVKYLMNDKIQRFSLSSFDFDHKDKLYKVESIITACAKEENKLQ